MTFRRWFAAFTLVAAGMVSAQQTTTPGEVWRSQTEGSKLMFVYGFVMGHKAGAERQQFPQIVAECGEVEPGWTRERLMENVACVNKSRPTRSHMRGQDAQLLVEGLNAIYGDVANSRIDLPFSLSIMQEKLLGNMTDEQFQGAIENARAVGARSN